MKKQAFNPYLPSYEYIPDGEPYVFGDRVYVYGSHDCFDGTDFCLNDYVCWSAPTNDLGNWRYEGVIYRRGQDPLNQKNKEYLYAPDVQQGPDGRFYLFYALNLSTVISVAVCDTPAGEYKFHGHVSFPDGHVFGTQVDEVNNFDPGVLVDDDGRVYLYTGFAPTGIFKTLMKMRKRRIDGAYCVELEPDMLTVKGTPKLVIPGDELAKGTPFDGHAFFEASSLRKVKGRYYFIYSSILSHELCYATSDRPDGGFVYGGTLVSNGDIGYKGSQQAVNYTGNTHGSIVEINDDWYVFYHRQTNRQHCSRQGCAERINILKDGSIPQVEVTSCGLNNAPLSGTGTYEARIACNLSSAEGTTTITTKKKTADKKPGKHPFFTQSGQDRESNGDQYIANMQNGAWAGFKYFDFHDEKQISIEARGSAKGVLEISTQRGGKSVARIDVVPSKDWTKYSAALQISAGTQALFFTYKGEGAMDFHSFSIQ